MITYILFLLLWQSGLHNNTAIHNVKRFELNCITSGARVKCVLKDTTAHFNMTYDHEQLAKDTVWVSADTNYVEIDGKAEMWISELFEVFTFSDPFGESELATRYPRQLITDVSELKPYVKRSFSRKEIKQLCEGNAKVKILGEVIDAEGRAHALYEFQLICSTEAFASLRIKSLAKLYDGILPALRFCDGDGMKKYGAQYGIARVPILICFSKQGISVSVQSVDEIFRD